MSVVSQSLAAVTHKRVESIDLFWDLNGADLLAAALRNNTNPEILFAVAWLVCNVCYETSEDRVGLLLGNNVLSALCSALQDDSTPRKCCIKIAHAMAIACHGGCNAPIGHVAIQQKCSQLVPRLGDLLSKPSTDSALCRAIIQCLTGIMYKNFEMQHSAELQLVIHQVLTWLPKLLARSGETKPVEAILKLFGVIESQDLITQLQKTDLLAHLVKATHDGNGAVAQLAKAAMRHLYPTQLNATYSHFSDLDNPALTESSAPIQSPSTTTLPGTSRPPRHHDPFAFIKQALARASPFLFAICPDLMSVHVARQDTAAYFHAFVSNPLSILPRELRVSRHTIPIRWSIQYQPFRLDGPWFDFEDLSEQVTQRDIASARQLIVENATEWSKNSINFSGLVLLRSQTLGLVACMLFKLPGFRLDDEPPVPKHLFGGGLKLPTVVRHGWYRPCRGTQDFANPSYAPGLRIGNGLSLVGQLRGGNVTLGAIARDNEDRRGLLTCGHLLRDLLDGVAYSVEHRQHYSDYFEALAAGDATHEELEEYARNGVLVGRGIKGDGNDVLGNVHYPVHLATSASASTSTSPSTSTGEADIVGIDALFIPLLDGVHAQPEVAWHPAQRAGRRAPQAPRLGPPFDFLQKCDDDTGSSGQTVAFVGLKSGYRSMQARFTIGSTVCDPDTLSVALQSATNVAQDVMHNQIVLVSSPNDDDFCNGGDSGSLVWYQRTVDDDASPVAQPLGLINGKLAHMTILSPLAAILHHLGLTLELPAAPT